MGEATSNVPHFFKTEEDRSIVAGGGIMLWALSGIMIVYLGLSTLESSVGIRRRGEWQASAFPRSLLISQRALLVWASTCAATTAALVALASSADAGAWGPCAQDNVCVYHQMFCEATRHGSAVRHPANAWSNLLYVYTAVGILLLAAKESGMLSVHTSRLWDPFSPPKYSDVTQRPFQLLDVLFALVLLSMASASFVWHASNCTWIHFVDIGLMNCVIAFFPYRFLVAVAARLFGSSEADVSGVGAAGYAGVCALLFFDMVRRTETFAAGFPTGVARASNGLSAVDTALYIGLPGLYPVPTLLLMANRRKWGHTPSMLACLVALPLAFTGHASEKLVLDFFCEPTSLLLQPTATFHVFSGVAIAAAYVQARALME